MAVSSIFFFLPSFLIYCRFSLVYPGNVCYMNGETLLKRTYLEFGHLRVSAKMLLAFTAWLLPFPLWLTGLATIQVNLHRTRRGLYSETKQLHDIHVQRERQSTHTAWPGSGGFPTRYSWPRVGILLAKESFCWKIIPSWRATCLYT